MFTEPTLVGFSDWIRSRLELSVQRAKKAVAQVENLHAAKGMYQSGATPIRVFEEIHKELELGIDDALAQLKRTLARTQLDRNALRQATEQQVRTFIEELKIASKHEKLRKIERGGLFIDGQLELLRIKLERKLQHFDAGFHDPSEPTEPWSMTDNSINIGGSMIGSAIQNASLNAIMKLSNEEMFAGMRRAVETGVKDETERKAILAAQVKLEKAFKGDENGRSGAAFGVAYQEFIAAAANHMTIVAPFIPALTKYL
jgi:hypothetical protein